MRWRCLALAAILAATCGTIRAGDAPSPVVLKNAHLAIAFDRQTGAWIGLRDVGRGDELVAEPAPRRLMLPAPSPPLDLARVGRAVAEGRAIDLTGQWLYTPNPPNADDAALYVQGRFDRGQWAPTTVPSRRNNGSQGQSSQGEGDDRLHNREGSFYYRRMFDSPAQMLDAKLVLILGAVDDFDETYLNGRRIGSTGVETPHHWESPRFYRVPAGLLRRGKPNDLVVKVTNAAYDGGIDGPVALGPVSVLQPADAAYGPPATHTLARSNSASLLTWTAQADGYEYSLAYVLDDNTPSFSRRLTVKNVSGQAKLLQHVALATPSLSVGPAQAAVFPGSVPAGDQPLAQLMENEAVAPRSEEPVVVLWDAGARRGLGAWHHCEEEFSPGSVRARGAGAEIRHVQRIVVRLAPGESVALGRQHFWLAHGSRDDALRPIQQVYRAIGLRAPANGLAALDEKVVYCCHPGGTPEEGFQRKGGFRAVENYVPTLKRMGVDLVWLLPIWDHGDDPRWNLYSPFDHFTLGRQYGTPEDLKRLAAACSQRGMHLMFDLVPHGPPDFTPLAKSHPEWACLDAAGKPVYAWSQLAFDNAHPGWQDYMRRAAQYDAEQYGAIGARVDCGAGGPLNWNPAVGNRPSRSSLAAGLGMNRAIREGFLKAGPQVVILPEEYTGANLFNRIADLTYDAQFYYLQADLHAAKATPERWAEAIAQFLHDQQATLPPGSLKMRWISNHDTVSWTFQKQRPLALYGADRTRALLALCALVPGVPMLYEGDENPAVYGRPGPSSVEFLSQVYGLRKRLPALRSATADYRGARASGGVFACLRCFGGQTALVLVSFNSAAIESKVSLPAELAGYWGDALSGETLALDKPARIAMKPHQVRVLTRRE